MQHFEKIINGIYRLEVPFGTCWTGIVFIPGEENVLIDSAASDSAVDEYLVPALGDMGYNLSDIKYLLCTHTHGDHVGGHFRIRELCPDIKMVCWENSADKLRDPLKYNIAIRKVFPEYSAPPSTTLKGVEPDIVLGEYDDVAGLRLIPAKGHDNDTACWYHLSTKTMITGDSLQANGTVSQGCALYMYLPEYRATLARLDCIDIENIITGHDYLPVGSSAVGKEKSCEYLAKCAELVEYYKDFIRRELKKKKTAPEIATALIGDIKGVLPPYLFLPLYTVTEHLKELKNEK